jgi:hypothetical protein
MMSLSFSYNKVKIKIKKKKKKKKKKKREVGGTFFLHDKKQQQEKEFKYLLEYDQMLICYFLGSFQ